MDMRIASISTHVNDSGRPEVIIMLQDHNEGFHIIRLPFGAALDTHFDLAQCVAQAYKLNNEWEDIQRTIFNSYLPERDEP